MFARIISDSTGKRITATDALGAASTCPRPFLFGLLLYLVIRAGACIWTIWEILLSGRPNITERIHPELMQLQLQTGSHMLHLRWLS